MAVGGDDVDDDDDPDMLVLFYRFAGTRHCGGVHAIWRSSGCTCACGGLWLQWPVAAGCGKPVAAMPCGRWLWKALAAGVMLLRALLFSGTASADRT